MFLFSLYKEELRDNSSVCSENTFWSRLPIYQHFHVLFCGNPIVLGQKQPRVNFLGEMKIWVWIGRNIKEIYPFKLLRSSTQKNPRTPCALELRPDQWNGKDKALDMLPYGDSCNTSKVVKNVFPGRWVYRSQIYFMTNMDGSFKGIAQTHTSGGICFVVTKIR